MKSLSLFLLTFISIYGATLKGVEKDFTQQNFKRACLEGSKILAHHRGNEQFINNVANACLKSDYIDLLAQPIRFLRESPKSRKQAIYYATVQLQKRLLYHAIMDDASITGIRLPHIDYILSEVVDYLAAEKYEKAEGYYLIKTPEKQYKIQKIFDKNTWKVEVVLFRDGLQISKHLYW